MRVRNVAGHLEEIPPSGFIICVRTEMRPAYDIKLEGGGVLTVVDESMFQTPTIAYLPQCLKKLSDVKLPPAEAGELADLKRMGEIERDLRIGLGDTYYIVTKTQRIHYRNQQLVSADFIRNNTTGLLDSQARVLVCNYNPSREGGQ